MSIQWTFIAGYLYFEIAIVLILILPIASPRRWNRFFNSRLFSLFRSHAAVYFYVLLGVLALFLMDAVREMRKYSQSADGGHIHVAAEMKTSVKLFRAQRNFYITGFSIFLAFVIRRLVTIIIIQSELLEKSADIVRGAQTTSEIAKKISSDDERQFAIMKIEFESAQAAISEYEQKIDKLQTEVALWKSKYEELEQKLARGDQ